MPQSDSPSLPSRWTFSDYGRCLDSGAPINALLAELDARDKAYDDPAIWIDRLAAEKRALWVAAASTGIQGKALRGLPFAIKDNIDLAGTRSTAACPSFNPTPAEVSAPVVERLVEAGAIPIGKTNMDQFATGLVGVRSPYGTPRNTFDPRYIPGGSSSGSAAAVAAGLCAFSLGTDTAGSGRVPASLNELVGYKPTRGLISTRGVVPACRTLDCVSIFARTVGDAAAVARVAIGFDPLDPFSRACPPTFHRAPKQPTVAVPSATDLEFFGDTEAADLFKAATQRLKTLGMDVVEIDYRAFREAASLLYEGPWVAERYLAVGSHLEAAAEVIHPITREIISKGAHPRAADAFRAFERLAGLRQQAEQVWNGCVAMLTPTLPTPYLCEEVSADPIRLNSRLGTYTNHFNLLDLCGIAVPAGRLRGGTLPWGVTFSAPAFHDDVLFDLASRFLAERLPEPALRPTGTRVEVAVCGAHLRGFPLNQDLVRLGGAFVEETTTRAAYRFYALAGTVPAKPGLVRVDAGGFEIGVEVWSIPEANFGRLVAGIPSPLGIGTVELVDGRTVKGFLCESAGLAGAEDISHLGNWRRYTSARAKD
ncbi:MAG: allophanate hydrolase [Opitutaceae bacterium]|nr:allophanate hydrolase [Opitutaceae bacterium]